MSEDMDDKDLREAFGEYVDGVQSPPASVTERAKNQIRRQNTRSRLIKRITVAVACVACACLCTVGIIYSPIIGIGGNKTDAPGSVGNMGNMGGTSVDANKPASPDAPGSTGVNYYPQSGLTALPLDVYGTLPDGLDFVKTANLATNCAVTELTAYYGTESLAYAKTGLTSHVGGVRREAEIYAEYTDDGSVCEIFGEHLSGVAYYFKNDFYRVSFSQENGEWISKVYLPADGVKYYLTVKSSDKQAYGAYLSLILSKK